MDEPIGTEVWEQGCVLRCSLPAGLCSSGLRSFAPGIAGLCWGGGGCIMWVLVISGAVLLLSVGFQMLVMLWVWLTSHRV